MRLKWNCISRYSPGYFSNTPFALLPKSGTDNHYKHVYSVVQLELMPVQIKMIAERTLRFVSMLMIKQ